MARQMHSLQILIEIPYAGGAQGTPRLSQVNCVACDDTDAMMKLPGGLDSGDDPAVPRDLLSGDLTGTVQTLIDGIETAAKTKMGVA